MSEKVLGFKFLKSTPMKEADGNVFYEIPDNNLPPVVSLEWLEKELSGWNKIVSQDERLSLFAKCLVGKILNSVISKAKKIG